MGMETSSLGLNSIDLPEALLSSGSADYSRSSIVLSACFSLTAPAEARKDDYWTLCR